MEPEYIQDFDPETYPPEYVVVGATEMMSSILERVEDCWARTPFVVLVVPRATLAFHTTHDLLALGKLQDSREVRVSIASHDPVVTGLGKLLGFYVMDPPPDHPALAGDPALGSLLTDSMEQPTAPLPLGASSIAPEWVFIPPTPPAGTTTSTWLNATGDPPAAADVWAANPFASGAPAHRAGVPPPRTRPRQPGQMETAIISDVVLPTIALPETLPKPITTPTGSLKARRVVPKGRIESAGRFRYGGRVARANWRRMIAVLSAVLIVTLAAASTYAYIYLPVGSVQVTTLSQAISDKPIEISVITPQEGSAPGTSPLIAPSRDNAQTGPSITAQSLRTALTEEGTRAASGTRQQPRGKATGTMRFANRTGNVVNVPIGTQFKGANGVTVQTTQGGSVPPTAFINQSVGTLELPVAATVEGPDGNIASGQVAGTWKGLLDYTNTALQGGTMETVKVIKQEDIDVLAAELRAKAEGEAASAVVGLVGPGQTLITPTISLTNAQFTVLDHKAGDDGESVRVRFTAEAGGYAYEESQMHDSINQAMLDSVQTSIPLTVGPSLDMASVTSGPPVIASTDQGRVVYRTRANGRVTFALTPELASRIRILIKGKRISEASNLILQNYGSYLNPDSIEAKVLWFNLNTLPNDPGRIIVQPTKGRP